jgi:hypothetical protein
MNKRLLKLALLSALSASLMAGLSPNAAQATTNQRLICDATIATSNGATLIYQVSGTLELSDAGQPVPPTQDTASLTMTVIRRDRNGSRQTLLNRSPLSNYERVAPDADYSQLPFTGSFQGLPNDGQGLYSVTSSANGLYASLRPVQGIPPKVQIVHYLSPGQFVRSTNGTCRTR